MFDLNLSWGGVLDFRVQNLIIFLIIVQFADRLTDIKFYWNYMCLIEETVDSTHRRTGRGGGGGGRNPPAPPPPPPPTPNFGQLRFFGQQEKFGQSQFLHKFPCFLSSFFSFERYIFYFKLK